MEALFTDYHHVLFAYLMKGKHDQIRRLREEPTRSIVHRTLSLVAHRSPMQDLEALRVIETLQGLIETELCRIISKKGIQYWFHVYRRLAPVATFSNESPHTVGLYREITECAFLKYGATSCGNELILGDLADENFLGQVAKGALKKAHLHYGIPPRIPPSQPSAYVGNFDFESLVEMLQVERLAFEFWHTTVCIRRLYKGGVLHIDEDCDYYVINDRETEKLIEAYDRRGYGYGDLITTQGIPMRGFESSGNRVALCAKYNIEQIRASEYPIHVLFGLPESLDNEFVPNFLWVPVDFDHYYTVHQFYEEQFKDRFKVSLRCFVTTLYLVNRRALVASQLSHGKQALGLMKRAYGLFDSREMLVDDLIDLSRVRCLPSLAPYTPEPCEVKSVLDLLTLDPTDRDKISLTTRGPRPLIFPCGSDRFILDYAAVLPILMTQTHFLKAQIDKKGVLFERHLMEMLEHKGLKLWVCHKELRHFDGTSREIDISFFHKGILFIAELKCITRSLAFERGDIEALEFRRRKLQAAVEKVDECADWLSTRREGTNYKIPDETYAIVPFVVSPFTEYVWATDQRLWLTDEVPRICLPSEVEHLVDAEALNEVLKRPFVRYLT